MTKLIDSIVLQLDAIHIEKINQIDSFDFSKTTRKVDHDLGGLTKQYLLDGIENLKRYYVVALLDPLNEHAVSRYVDPFWHAHVLHTKEYIEFCDSIFGQYIHHKPLDLDDHREVKEVTMLYNYTKEIYKSMFSSVSEQWWPEVVNQSAVGPIPIVCRHMLITNEQISRKALFPRNVLQAA